MSFWPFGRGPKEPEPVADAPAPAPEQAAAPRLGVVEFWTAYQRVKVGIVLGSDRLTDLINRVVTIRVVPLD